MDYVQETFYDISKMKTPLTIPSTIGLKYVGVYCVALVLKKLFSLVSCEVLVACEVFPLIIR